MSHSDSLAALNSTTLGTTMPVVTLPDGSQVQTGTVGALLKNIKAYDQLVAQENVDQAERKELEAKLAAALPVLKKVGFFELFTPQEWMQGSSPGRKYVGEMAAKDRS
ncbi:hypothetical protein BS50DRAFT_579859 [Corynespora cassiicola Philippines]|uniref:DUF7709 domain-containing protein n=1 Tax=Corynespora cassiicola Philippines TaxID=1448308 RepID=A0A2T2N2I3_CORCC|nr:hypothetical protein BS50DRAFT_579859 [Corynespora cassiicola Philippines]